VSSELKVYNRFDELTLHLRLSLGASPELLTVDGTPEMRAAIANLKGNDFDRTVVKGNELIRLTADWGSGEYLSVLGRYFVLNFGWSTKIVETAQPSTSVNFAASGNLAPLEYGVVSGNLAPPQCGVVGPVNFAVCNLAHVNYGIAGTPPFAVTNAVITANVIEDRPDFLPKAPTTAYGIPDTAAA
jgi:hypothetical protein